MLDWIELNSKYPKSIIKLSQWILEDEEVDNNSIKECCEYYTGCDFFLSAHFREFYDFFDENGFHINITCEEYIDGNNFIWQISWYGDGTQFHGDNNELSTRRSAEKNALNKAFELLETKIWLLQDQQ
jgi:hypothetical protein